jgi:MYXO-CTERM domain-containing protein
MSRRSEFLSLITIAAVASATATRSAESQTISHLVQWKGADGGNDHWYGVIGTYSSSGLGLSWTDARSQAQSLGGDLVSLTSSAENDFVYNQITSDASLWHATTSGNYCYAWGPWIGLSAVNGAWTWSDGSAFSYAAWGPGEPYEGTSGYVQYYRYYQNWGPPIPDSRWDNAGIERGMFAVVEWTSNPVPAPAAAAPLLALAGLTVRGRRRR